MSQHEHREPLPPSWIERNVRTIVRGLVGVCVALLVFDVVFHFVGHKHVHFRLEAIPGFYAVAGFLSYVGLVLTAKQLRKVVMRPNDYYGEEPAPAPAPAKPHEDVRASHREEEE